MEMISQFAKFSAARKALFIAGILTLLASTCVIFPIERSNTSFLEGFVYTFSILAASLLLLMSGLMGKNFFKGILFIAVSSIIGAVFFYVAYPPVPFAAFIAIWLGIPSGIIAALVFMIVNFYFFKEIKSFRVLRQTTAYLAILCVVSVLFGYGGDWFFEITEYFRDKR